MKMIEKYGADGSGKGKKRSKTIDKEEGYTFKKHYLKTRPVCKVTFRLRKEAAPEARSVTIVGDFNNWDRESDPMRQLKNGDFSLTIYLEKGKYYCFRYLIDGARWENDWCADRYVPNPYGGDDSVVVV